MLNCISKFAMLVSVSEEVQDQIQAGKSEHVVNEVVSLNVSLTLLHLHKSLSFSVGSH